MNKKRKPLELYVHIPFCIRKCAYCDFVSGPGTKAMQKEYEEALLAEIDAAEEAAESEVISVFFGGGTPSAVDAGMLARVMEKLRSKYVFSEDAEITLEANPGTLDAEKLKCYRKSGFNRISIGCQSVHDEELKRLGRIHTFAEFQESFALARDAGFANINVDLMSGLPEQSEEKWEESLRTIAELSPEHREKIRNSKRVANPGCYASGFISICYPLVKAGVLPQFYPVFAYATSGYSGAGKKAIAAYESDDKPEELLSPRQYALDMNHKHLPEMQKISGLAYKPMFNPIVDNYYSGMVVSIPLQGRLLQKRFTPEQIRDVLYDNYKDSNFVEVKPAGSECVPDGFLTSNGLSGTNRMEIYVFGDNDQMLLCSRLDNLGKGASGAAVQCLNIMMGIDETTGLI